MPARPRGHLAPRFVVPRQTCSLFVVPRQTCLADRSFFVRGAKVDGGSGGGYSRWTRRGIGGGFVCVGGCSALSALYLEPLTSRAARGRRR